ncbi:MAG: ferric reductase-like transmembrane domain-containing protein [Planctomycetales bacterium]
MTVGWKSRHLIVIVVAAIGTYVFLLSRQDWSEMHRWNRAVGDTSLVLIAASMAIGPLSRLVPRLRAAVPWRRELGIYGVFLSLVHATIILLGWVDLDLWRLIGYEVHPATGQYVMSQHGFGLANIIGILALIYAIVLAGTSNNWSQRSLGTSVWKFVQQGSYVLWILIVVHTGYFLYLHFQHFHVQSPEPNWAQWPFVVLILAVVALQLVGMMKTWRVKIRGRIMTSSS